MAGSDRRETLKIIGAVGTTCAFPFSADELYGQHVHPSGDSAAVPPTPTRPVFFTDNEFDTVKALADLIIPPTETPGAAQAGVPFYIDYVVSSNEAWKKLFREGLAWLEEQSAISNGKRFHNLDEETQIAILAPLVKAADRRKAAAMQGASLEVRFVKAFKSMTADGYFTSKPGLVETLGYRGNTVLGEFPNCEIG